MHVKPFDLYERIEHQLLTLFAEGERERLIRRHCGLLRRSGNGRRDWMSMALNTLKLDAIDATAAKRKMLEEGLDIKQSVDLDRIARHHDRLFETLNRLLPGAWKVQYRAETNRRLHLPHGREPLVSTFDYLGLLVSIDLGEHQIIELGEGGVKMGQIPVDGLCRRIETLIENHRRRRPVTMTGPVDLVLAPGDGAILFHEMAGHALEADHVSQRRSPLWQSRLGAQVASESLTLTSGDEKDPFFSEIRCDDEGEAYHMLDLIREGKLVAFMGDGFHSAELEGCHRGFARCSDFTQVPQPRMYGMFVKPGSQSPDEIVSRIEQGIYASEFGQGSAMLERDRFHFRILSAHMIEKGRITEPLGAIDVTGSIRESLLGVKAIGNDYRFDRGVSYCVKNRQLIHVRVGQPTVHMGGVGVKPLMVI